MLPGTLNNASDSIKLEPIGDVDFEILISWIGNEEILMQFAGPAFSFPLTLDQLQKNSAEINRHCYKVVDECANRMIGYAEIYLSATGTARLCRIIIGDKNQRGYGIGQKLVKHLLNTAFNELNVSKVDLNVFDWNTAAIKCYEKCGFEINPHKSVTRQVNGQTWKGLNMEINKTDWYSRLNK